MKKVVIIGPGQENSELIKRSLMEKHGDDIVIVTKDQAEQMGISADQIVNDPPTLITDPYHKFRAEVQKSGKQNRRERRKAERKNKNKK